MKNPNNTFKLSLSLTLILMLTAISLILNCSSDTPTEPGGNTNTFDTLTVTIPVSQASSMSWIKLDGIPANNDSAYAIVLPVTKANDTGYAPILYTDTGDYLVVPLNPADPVGGGTVQILITDDFTFISQAIQLSLNSLPEAPGEFAAIVSLLQQSLDQKLRITGINRDSLDAIGPGNNPVQHFPLLIAYDALDRPDNPNALTAFVDGTAPIIAEEGPLMLDLLDRTLALTGYKEYLQEYVDSLELMDTISLASSDNYSAKDRQSLAGGVSFCIPAPNLGITDCADLAEKMNRATRMDRVAKSAGRKVLKDLASNSLMMIGMIPAGKIAATGLGTVVFIDAKVQEGAANMMPSEFVDGATTWDPSVTDFAEDFTAPGKWTKFQVTAISRGWKLDALVMETILRATSLNSAMNRWKDVPPPIQTFIDGIDQTLKSTVVSKGSKYIVNEFAGESGIVEICSNTWSNINCVEDDYSDVTVSTGAMKVDEIARTYEPTAVGNATFRIETTSAFGADNTGTAHAISTKAIEVSIDPFQAEADTTEWVEFHYLVRNAENTEVGFTTENGGTILIQDASTVTVETPPYPWNPPVLLIGTSKASTGLRATSNEERTDDSEISYKGDNKFVINPESICIQPGATENFNLIAVEGTIDSIRWITNPPNTGSFVQQGSGISYTAPNTEEGLIDLIAIVNGSDTAYSIIDISNCVCYWNMSGIGSGGTGNLSIAGELFPGYIMIELSQGKSNSDPPYAHITITNFSGIGIHDSILVQYTDATPSIWVPIDTLVPWPTMHVVEYVPNDYMLAVIQGELQQIIPGTEPVQIRRQLFILNFRAEFSLGVHETICSSDSI